MRYHVWPTFLVGQADVLGKKHNLTGSLRQSTLPMCQALNYTHFPLRPHGQCLGHLPVFPAPLQCWKPYTCCALCVDQTFQKCPWWPLRLSPPRAPLRVTSRTPCLSGLQNQSFPTLLCCLPSHPVEETLSVDLIIALMPL